MGEGWCWATSPAECTVLNSTLIASPPFRLQSSTRGCRSCLSLTLATAPTWAPISQPAPDISPSGLLAPPLSISGPSFTFQLKQKPSRTPPSTPLGPAIRPCIPTQCHCSLPPGPVPHTSLSCLLGSRTGRMQAPAGIPCRPAPPTPSGLSRDVTSSREPSLSRVSPAGHLPSPPEFRMSLLPVGARCIVLPLLTGL